MLHHRDGARFPPDVTLNIQAKEFNLGFIRPENLVSHDLRVLLIPFGKLQECCHVPFTEEWLSSGHYHKGLIGGMLQRWLSFWEVLLSPQRNSVRVELCQSDHRVLGHLPDLLPRLLSLAWWPALGSHLRMMEATVLLGTFNAADLSLDTILARSSTDNSFDLKAWFLL